MAGFAIDFSGLPPIGGVFDPGSVSFPTQSGQVSTVPGAQPSSGGGVFSDILKALSLGLQGWQIYNTQNLASQAINKQAALSYNPQTGQPYVNVLPGSTNLGSAGSVISMFLPWIVLAVVAVFILKILE